MMRARWIAGLTATLGLGLGAGPVQAAEVTSVATLAPAPGGVSSFLPLPGGGAAVVRSLSPIYDGPGDVTVDLARPGRAVVRATLRRSLLAGAAVRSDGGVALLVKEAPGSDFLSRLSLWTVSARGRTRRIWRTAPGADGAALAHAGRRVAVVWTRRTGARGSQLVTRLAVGTEASGLRRSHTLTRVVGPVGADGYIANLALSLTPGGTPTVAVVRSVGRRRPGLILAETTATGRVRTRQYVPGVEGLVRLVTAPSGRTGVLLEDTGIEGEVGECVQDGKPRRVRAGVREAGSHRFAPLQLLDTLPLVCSTPGARLVAAPDGRMLVGWGTGDEGIDPALPGVRLALAPAGRGFAKRETPIAGAYLRGLAFSGGGALSILATTPPDGTSPFDGPLSVRTRPAGGEDGPEAALAPFTSAVGAITGADGHVLALLGDGSDRLQVVGLG